MRRGGEWELGWWAPVPPAVEPGELVDPGVHGALLSAVADGAPPSGWSAVPPAPWFPPELTHWEARWVLLHLATETARHAGHADIIRESIDGKGSYELNALADGQSWGDWG